MTHTMPILNGYRTTQTTNSDPPNSDPPNSDPPNSDPPTQTLPAQTPQLRPSQHRPPNSDLPNSDTPDMDKIYQVHDTLAPIALTSLNCPPLISQSSLKPEHSMEDPRYCCC